VVCSTVLLWIAAWPVSAQSTPDEPTLLESPNACSYLTEDAARGFLGVERVRPSAANEHIPDIWSQCIYSGEGGRSVSFVFKFMIWDLFDTALDPIQLDFNAQFTGGGVPPSEKRDEPGKIAYAFEDRDRTTLMVVTGIQGPPDGFGRPSELVATYLWEGPEGSYAEKLARLLDVARAHVAEWLADAGR